MTNHGLEQEGPLRSNSRNRFVTVRLLYLLKFDAHLVSVLIARGKSRLVHILSQDHPLDHLFAPINS